MKKTIFSQGPTTIITVVIWFDSGQTDTADTDQTDRTDGTFFST